jgi:hypothetical protein
VLTANGKHIAKPAPGGEAASRWCDSTPLRAEAENEDAQSVGTLISFGKFRFLFLSDLTWNNGIRLVCPKNLVGPVDVFLTTHHAMQVDKENGGEAISSYSYIANLATQNCPANWLNLTDLKDGSFSIANTRTGFVKQYQTRK